MRALYRPEEHVPNMRAHTAEGRAGVYFCPAHSAGGMKIKINITTLTFFTNLYRENGENEVLTQQKAHKFYEGARIWRRRYLG